MMRVFHSASIIWLSSRCRPSFQAPALQQLHSSLHPRDITATYEIPGVRIDLEEKFRDESVLCQAKKEAQRFIHSIKKHCNFCTEGTKEANINIEPEQQKKYLRMFGASSRDSTVEAKLLDEAKGLPILRKFLGTFHKYSKGPGQESQGLADTLIKEAFLYLLRKPHVSDQEGKLWIEAFAYVMKAGQLDPQTADRESIVQHGLLSLHSKYSSPGGKTLQLLTSSLSLVLKRRLEVAQQKGYVLRTGRKAWVSEILEPSCGLSPSMRNWELFKLIIKHDTKLSACLKAFSQEDESLMVPWIEELERICYKDSPNTSAETRTAAVAFLYHIGFNKEMGGVRIERRQEAQKSLRNLLQTTPNSQLNVHTHLFTVLSKVLELDDFLKR